MKRLTIALDMDDVFADASLSLLNHFNANHGTTYTLDQMNGQNFNEFFSPEDFSEIRSYLFMPHFFEELPIIEGASEVLPDLVEKHDVFVVSAAQEFPLSLSEKSFWLDRNFPMIKWTNRVFCGVKSIIDADVLIDDHIYNLNVFKGKGYLFSRFHNLNLTGYDRLKDWDDIRNTFC